VAVLLLSAWLFWAWPPILEATLTQLHPPEHRQKRVLGFIPVARADVLQRIEAQRSWATRAIWGLSGGVVLWLLWAHVRPSSTEAAAISRRREREADALAPGARKRLPGYRAAHRLALDRQRESLLLEKLAREAEMVPATVFARDGGNRYRVQDEIGRGGMGVVFRGFDPLLGREVALKRLSRVISGDPDTGDSLRKEARALARLSHPNIVQVFDIVEDSRGIWIVLELIDGTDVGARIRETGSLAPAEVGLIGSQVAAALASAHSRGLLHRDVKPANILLTAQEEVKLTDFGIAKLLTPEGGRTRTGLVIGSPRYMSPEQRRGAPLDGRSDIYSLGVTLYEMLTGHVPDSSEPLRTPGIPSLPAPSRPSDLVDLPADLDRLVMEMLAESPHDRPSEMKDVIARLAAIGKPEIVEL
jgi:hypothetical protein